MKARIVRYVVYVWLWAIETDISDAMAEPLYAKVWNSDREKKTAFTTKPIVAELKRKGIVVSVH